jgi:hypothetical protein
MLIDVTIPGDRNVVKKEAEKIVKCKDIIIEIQWMWNVNLYRTAFKSRLRAHGTEFSPRRPFKCPVHM